MLKIEDNKLAENYLIRANWNIDEAKKLYESENSIHFERNNILDETQIEFNISEALNESNEVFTPKNKDLYDDFIKFLEKLFNKKTVSNFKNFFNLSKNNGGLIIIFPEENIEEIRNNLIRAANNKNVNIIKNLTIFPVLKESKVANEISKVLKVKSFPFYMFCKYRNEETMAISFSLEKKFRMKDLIDILEDISNSLDLSFSLDGEKSKLNINPNDISGDSQNITINQIVRALNNTINNSINTSISLDGEKSKLNINPNDISEDSQNKTIYQIVRILNNSINTSYDAKYSDLVNLYNDSNNNGNNDNIDINDHKSCDKQNKDKTYNTTQNSSNVSSFTLEISNSSTPNIGEKTVIGNFIPEKNYEDTNICKIKFTNPNNNKYKIKQFIKKDKVSSLFDFVKNLCMDIHSKQNFGDFDLIHGCPQRQLSQVKNNTLMEECLCPFSEVFIIYLNK